MVPLDSRFDSSPLPGLTFLRNVADADPPRRREETTLAHIEKHDPSTGELLGTFPFGTPEDVAAAVARAREAFPAWRDAGLDERLAILGQLATVIRDQGEGLAHRMSADTGKPLLDSLMTELISVALFLDYYRKLAPKVLRRRKVKTPLVFQGKKSYVEYFPMGVVGIISPWNFPLQLSMIPAISALIGGNTVVLKPSEVTPITGEVIRELFAAIDLPEGAMEVVQGDGSTGAALVEADIDMVFFTGSVATGRKVMAAAAQKPIPVELELGGKDPMIVCGDANLRRAARGATWGGLLNCGQICTSVERIFVVESVHDRFVELLREEVARVKVGGPENQDCDMGPMTFPPQLNTVERHVREAQEAGARALCGGKRLEGPGQFFEPTVLVDVRPDMSIYREETFGPVLPVIKVKDEEEAVALANDHEYGLMASVWTGDVNRGMALASRLECGQVIVNDVLIGNANPAIPFGGVKKSGIGRYHGPEGLTTFQHRRAIMAGKDGADYEPFWFPYAGKYDDIRRVFELLIEGKLVRTLGPIRRLAKLTARTDEPKE